MTGYGETATMGLYSRLSSSPIRWNRIHCSSLTTVVAMRTRQQRYDAMKEKDKDRVMRSLLAWDRTAAISVVLAVFVWMIEGALDSFVFRLGPLHERLFPLNEPGEIWMRVEATGTFLI